MSLVFFGWIQNIEKQQRERERLQYEAEDAAIANVAVQQAGSETQS
jgi:hypothetical protein